MGNVPALDLCLRAKGHGENGAGTSGTCGYYDQAEKFKGV